MMYIFRAIFIMHIAAFFNCTALKVSHNVTNETPHKSIVTLQFQLQPGEFVYHDHIRLSYDSPNAQHGQAIFEYEPTTRYDKHFKEVKKIFNHNFSVSYKITHDPSAPDKDTRIRLTFLEGKKNTFSEKIIQLSQEHKNNQCHQKTSNTLDKTQKIQTKTPNSPKSRSTRKFIQRARRGWRATLDKATEWKRNPPIYLITILLCTLLVFFLPYNYRLAASTLTTLSHLNERISKNKILFHMLYTAIIASVLVAFVTTISIIQVYININASPFITLILANLFTFSAFSLYFFEKSPKVPELGTMKQEKIDPLILLKKGIPCGARLTLNAAPLLVALSIITISFYQRLQGCYLLFTICIIIALLFTILSTNLLSLTYKFSEHPWLTEARTLFVILFFGIEFYTLHQTVPWNSLLLMIGIFNFAIGILYLQQAPNNNKHLRIIKTFIGCILIASMVVLAVQSLQIRWLDHTNTTNQIKN